MRYLLVLMIAVSLNSCAYHSGMMSSNASLSGNDFEILELVSVQTSTKKYFGFGGLAKDALVLEAKKKLYAKYPLKKGQVFANISVDFQEKYILIFNQTTVTLSADIVQFDGIQSEKHKVFNTIKKLDAKQAQSPKSGRMIKCGNESFFISEEVYYQSGEVIAIGEVKSILNNLVLIHSDEESVDLHPSLVYHKLFEEDQPEVALEVNGTEVKGKIVGKNSKRVVLNNGGKLTVFSKNQIRL